MTASRLTVTMAAALELVAQGIAPRAAAAQAGVNRVALYAAMRRLRVGPRCPTCGRMLTRRTAEA